MHYRPKAAEAEAATGDGAGGAGQGGAPPVPAGAQHHAYLLLSFQGSTKVLATGEELREVTEM